MIPVLTLNIERTKRFRMKVHSSRYWSVTTTLIISLILVFGCQADKNLTRAEVNTSILKYSSREQYDRAIAVGEQWVQRNPQDDIIRMQLASVYLDKARKDVAHRKELVMEATRHASKAVAIEPDGLVTLQLGSAAFESAGDLSASSAVDRCDNYRAALRLAEKENLRLQEHDKVSDPKWTSARQLSMSTTTRVRGKLESSGCS
jgi:hypothetical protein